MSRRYDTTQPSSEEKIYQFPDGIIITVRAERFRCFEVWFLPSSWMRRDVDIT